jgi:hypothetical protein
LKPIRILTPAIDILAEIDDYESLSFTRRFHEVGAFELRINRHKKHVGLLQKGNLVMLGNQAHKVGVILHREITLTEAGKLSETWLIRGVTLSGVMARRITIPPSGLSHDKITADAESVLINYVNNNVVAPADTSRTIAEVTLATNLNRGASLTWQSRYKNLADELRGISEYSGLGWQISLDFTAKKWQFNVLEGRDLTAGQTVNPPVIFSPDFDAIREQKYADSDLNYRNVGIVAGQGEGELRSIAMVGTATGLSRIETFIDARDVEIAADLPSRGEQKLAEFSTEQYLEAEILTHSPFKYEEDYDLGDLVTSQNKGWGVTLDARITEIKEIYEPSSGLKLEAVFGNSRPTLVDKVKQEIEQISGEIRK